MGFNRCQNPKIGWGRHFYHRGIGDLECPILEGRQATWGRGKHLKNHLEDERVLQQWPIDTHSIIEIYWWDVVGNSLGIPWRFLVSMSWPHCLKDWSHQRAGDNCRKVWSPVDDFKQPQPMLILIAHQSYQSCQLLDFVFFAVARLLSCMIWWNGC